jgi:hypothetical protein
MRAQQSLDPDLGSAKSMNSDPASVNLGKNEPKMLFDEILKHVFEKNAPHFTSEVLDILAQSLDALGERGQLLAEVPASHRQRHILNRQRHILNRQRHILNRQRHILNRQRHILNRQRHILNRQRHILNRQRHILNRQQHILIY